MMLRRRVFLVLLAAWAILVVGRLGQFLYDSTLSVGTPESSWQRIELEQRLSIESVVLNFPLSILAVPAVDVVGPVTGWCLLTLVGFVQWTVLMPAIWKAIRRRVTRA